MPDRVVTHDIYANRAEQTNFTLHAGGGDPLVFVDGVAEATAEQAAAVAHRTDLRAVPRANAPAADDDAAGGPEQQDAPDVPVRVPEGFSPTTDEGKPRCLAAKGDGTQCVNEAVTGTHACGLAPHKTKVAQLQAA